MSTPYNSNVRFFEIKPLVLIRFECNSNNNNNNNMPENTVYRLHNVIKAFKSQKIHII